MLLENIPGFARPTPLLVKVESEEVGLRSDLIPRIHVQFAAFLLHVQSEQTYDQDQGEDLPGAPSKRYGVELSAQYRPVHWLELNSDLSFSHARHTGANLADYGDTGPNGDCRRWIAYSPSPAAWQSRRSWQKGCS